MCSTQLFFIIIACFFHLIFPKYLSDIASNDLKLLDKVDGPKLSKIVQKSLKRTHFIAEKGLGVCTMCRTQCQNLSPKSFPIEQVQDTQPWTTIIQKPTSAFGIASSEAEGPLHKPGIQLTTTYDFVLVTYYLLCASSFWLLTVIFCYVLLFIALTATRVGGDLWST